MAWLQRLWQKDDARALAGLALLWLLFFWRLFTPIAEDQASLALGDFSGQFVAFAGYQYERLTQGEIPLWNPYNNGGLPFIADTQAAVWYPPRWLTIGLSALAGGWSYHALQLEMTAHVLLYSLLMYAFVRRLTLGEAHSCLGAFIAAALIGYGGYLTGYPPLQLAILEAAAWLPLMLLGILEGTRQRRLAYGYIVLAALGLSLSWLAGHPQTSFFLTYLAAAYLGWRCWQGRHGWRAFGGAFLLLAASTLCLTAVTLLPGVEYLLLTSRESLGFDAKGNGFPFRDILQMLFPGVLSQWSPLYTGIAALFFVAAALSFRPRASRFWLLVALVGLLHSLGANGALYTVSYNFIPGLRFFRGQERAAILVANSLAILAGIGVVAFANAANHAHKRGALRAWGGFSAGLIAITLALFAAWTGDSARWEALFEAAARSALFALAAYILLRVWVPAPGKRELQLALAVLIVFELFTVTMDDPATYDSVPHSEQLSMSPPPLLEPLLQVDGGAPFRVDGFRGLQDNFGSLYGIMDMRGISPLFLAGPQRLIYENYVDNPLAWELFAVKYVFSESSALSVPARAINSGSDRDGPLTLFQLENPRPFALLLGEAAVVTSDAWALELMRDPRFDERQAVVLLNAPTLELPAAPSAGEAEVLSFAPEEILLEIDSPANAILSLALPHYPGWQARLNGQDVELLRAYAGLSAVEIPAGKHRLLLSFSPLSYRLGALISLFAWLLLGAFALRKSRRS